MNAQMQWQLSKVQPQPSGRPPSLPPQPHGHRAAPSPATSGPSDFLPACATTSTQHGGTSSPPAPCRALGPCPSLLPGLAQGPLHCS